MRVAAPSQLQVIRGVSASLHATPRGRVLRKQMTQVVGGPDPCVTGQIQAAGANQNQWERDRRSVSTRNAAMELLSKATSQTESPRSQFPSKTTPKAKRHTTRSSGCDIASLIEPLRSGNQIRNARRRGGAHLSLLQGHNRTVGREARSSHEPGIGARTFLSARICRTNSRTRMSALRLSRTAPSSGGAVASDFQGRSSSAAADVTGRRTNSRTRMSALRSGAQGAKEAFSEFFPHSMGRGKQTCKKPKYAPLCCGCDRRRKAAGAESSLWLDCGLWLAARPHFGCQPNATRPAGSNDSQALPGAHLGGGASVTGRTRHRWGWEPG